MTSSGDGKNDGHGLHLRSVGMMARFTLFNMLRMESLVLVSFGGVEIWFGCSCIWAAGVSYPEKVLRTNKWPAQFYLGYIINWMPLHALCKWRHKGFFSIKANMEGKRRCHSFSMHPYVQAIFLLIQVFCQDLLISSNIYYLGLNFDEIKVHRIFSS
jgi:hypothetical protein